LRKRTLAISLILVVLIVSLAASIVYRVFFVRIVRVPTSAMANTIIPGDYLIVNRSFGRVERGQIAVFNYPGDKTWYIGRVVGLPGERIQLHDRTVYINDRLLEEQCVIVKPQEPGDYEPMEEVSTKGSGPYRVFYSVREQGPFTSPVDDDATIGTGSSFSIPRDSVFMLGDNRDNSEDSRFRGAVPLASIWGTASVIYWSAQVHSDNVRWERILKRVK
jgi:signal peptidase I